MSNEHLTIVGGGLAGCEAAWQAAQRGIKVKLYEMRPNVMTGAHQTDGLGELVCSNSLGSMQVDRGTGLLINEIMQLGSLLVCLAAEARVPAGSALAVDRERFSELITQKLTNHPNIIILREEVKEIPHGKCIIASGPLTSPALADALSLFTGEDNLFFFDAIAPIISGDSVNLEKAFWSSRYDRGEEEGGDYLNCPLTKEEYDIFIRELVFAEQIKLREFEKDLHVGVKSGPGTFFERCLPVEILASRGDKALAYGPMRPTGLTDPRTGRWPYAVVQLRHEDLMGESYNLVGFQTNLTFPEQERVFRLVPALENAVFQRHGQMHRNTFLCAPKTLNSTLQTKIRADLFFTGQLIGVEGYAGNIASGLVAGINAARYIKEEDLLQFPQETMLGAMLHYIANAVPEHFQPMKANFGLLPEIITPKRMQKIQKYQRKAEKAMQAMKEIAGRIMDAQ